MAKKSKKPDTSWMDDGDDAHFPDNPAVPKKAHKKHVSALTVPKVNAKKHGKKRHHAKKVVAGK